MEDQTTEQLIIAFKRLKKQNEQYNQIERHSANGVHINEQMMDISLEIRERLQESAKKKEIHRKVDVALNMLFGFAIGMAIITICVSLYHLNK